MRKNLKDARQKAGMTQQKMAELLKITARSYQRMESGESQGTIEHWDTLEDFFGIPQRRLREQVEQKEEEDTSQLDCQ